ncbi:MAG: alpha-amylase, partial [Deltaproteobacteria bacterium]|nr:alpha-amylase [Deltaproteobacteria bacterium]
AAFANPDWYHRRGRLTDWSDPAQVLNADFPSGLRDLDTTRADVREELIRVYGDWIERTDVDGFRLDAIKHVEHAFWREFCPAIRRRAEALGKARFFLFGEAVEGDGHALASFTLEGALDSVLDFRQRFVGFDGVFLRGEATRVLEELWDEKERIYPRYPNPRGIEVPATRALVTFLDNHDLPRSLSVRSDPRWLRATLAYQLTADGIPALYYGVEQDFAGGKDPANREDLWSTGYATGGETFGWIARLLELRKRHEALRRGETVFRWTTDHSGDEPDAGIVAFERFTETERVLVVVNASEHASRTSDGSGMRVGFAAGTELVDALGSGDEPVRVSVDGTIEVEVPALGARVLVPRG